MSFLARLIGAVFRILILTGYDEEWWKGFIPIYGDYVLCTLAAGPIYFFAYIGALAAMFFSVFTGSAFLIILFYIIAMIIYSVILFSLFISTDKLSVKIPVLCMFASEVLFGSISFISTIISS